MKLSFVWLDRGLLIEPKPVIKIPEICLQQPWRCHAPLDFKISATFSPEHCSSSIWIILQYNILLAINAQ
jgi:hypothetical protein